MRIKLAYLIIATGLVVLVVFRNMYHVSQDDVTSRNAASVLQRPVDAMAAVAQPAPGPSRNAASVLQRPVDAMAAVAQPAPGPPPNPDTGLYIDGPNGNQGVPVRTEQAGGDRLEPQDRQDQVVLASAPRTDRCEFCQVFDLRATPNMTKDIKCVPLRSTPPTTICIYPSDKDIYISKSIALSGLWEANEVLRFQGFLSRNPGMGIIDIGANIGVYTLSAAKMGRKVVAVEPNDEHVLRLHRAIHLEHLESQVTLLNNAVGDIRGTVKVKKHSNNQGASVVEQVNSELRGANDGVEIVNTIIMDDLAQFCDFSDAIMKIDIEGFEHKAFVHAERLFERVRVPVVMMEWAAMVTFAKQSETGPDRTLVMRMLNFFDSRRYVAHDWNNRKLSVSEWTSWPGDIVWVLDTVQF